MQISKVNNKEQLVHPASGIYVVLQAPCISPMYNRFQCGGPWNILVVGLRSFLHIFGLFIDITILPLSTPCLNCKLSVKGAWKTALEVHGWVMRTVSHHYTV